MKSLPTRDRGARRESQFLTSSALFAYRTLRRSGLLSTGVFRRLFLASYFHYKRYVEDPFRELVVSHPSLFAGGHVLDIGANVGYTTEVFSKAVKPSFKVFAFEPEPENYRALQTRFEQNDVVETIQCAVGDQDTVAELWVNPDHPGDHRVLTPALRERVTGAASTDTPVIRIDTFASERDIECDIAFVKVDVQGYELSVCRGMERVMARSRKPPVALEYAPYVMEEIGFRVDDLMDFMTRLAYVPHVIGRHGSLERTDAAELAKSVGEKDYVDLLFLKDDR